MIFPQKGRRACKGSGCRILAAGIVIALFCFSAEAYTGGDRSIKNSPNIIFILSDDLSWGDLGCYGQLRIKTPNLDRMAREGMRFTQAYAGSSECAPSRSSLMEGRHQGHARVRGNSFRSYRESLQKGDFTVAMLLRQAGYRTGLFGKWGLGLHNQPGIPNNMGFDEFCGYLNQRHAHCYYPEFLYHNRERIYFPENGEHHELENYGNPSPYDDKGKCMPNGIEDPSESVYSFDFYCDKSRGFIRNNKDRPFFLYLAYTIPHGPLIVPDLGEYKDKDWAIKHKEWAAMVTRMDTEVGRLLDLLDELGLEENTLIFFASDNGNGSYGYEKYYLETEPAAKPISEFFNQDSPTRGKKTDSYDGAYHVPALAYWPGQIAPEQVSDHIWAFWDFLPTAAAIAGVEPPSGIDGISILPVLTGKGKQEEHEYLYWEYRQNQAVRYGKWFAHRAVGGELELYDLITDPFQSVDMSQEHPGIVTTIDRFMSEAHTPSDVWPSPEESPKMFENRLLENKIPGRPQNAGLF